MPPSSTVCVTNLHQKPKNPTLLGSETPMCEFPNSLRHEFASPGSDEISECNYAQKCGPSLLALPRRKHRQGEAAGQGVRQSVGKKVSATVSHVRRPSSFTCSVLPRSAGIQKYAVHIPRGPPVIRPLARMPSCQECGGKTG